MKSDPKGRFSNKRIVIPFSNIILALDGLIILFFLLPLIFVGLKLHIYSKIYLLFIFLMKIIANVLKILLKIVLQNIHRIIYLF